MIIGVPQRDPKTYGWVVLRKSSDVVRSLNDRFGRHVGEPRGFDIFRNGRPFVGEQKLLPPSKQNNRLFADLVILKLNISASELQLIPNGLGELIFQEEGNSLSGMMVREIVARADSVMTYWPGIATAEYETLYSAIRKINAAFSGPIDTVSFGSQFRLTGVRKLAEVPFLRRNPSMAPRVVVTPSVVDENMPQVYELGQNYPNPFNPTTTIEFELARQSVVTLKIFNVLGQELLTLIENEEMVTGSYSIEFNGTSLASGVYFYRIVAYADDTEEGAGQELFTSTRKMILAK